jgi:mediator of RNA polymerase II transcription subunit 12
MTYFEQDAKAVDDFNVKLDILLTWSVTPLQYGDHRPFAAATLIQSWRNRACDRASRRDMGTPSEFLQDQLFDWLDTSDVAGEPSNIGNVALLYGKLVRRDIFSYSGYIQRLIARAEPGLAYTDVRPLSTSVVITILMIWIYQQIGSRHRLFLTWIPLHNASSALINQRKVILYGARARRTPEEIVEREIRGEIRSVIPELFECL